MTAEQLAQELVTVERHGAAVALYKVCVAGVAVRGLLDETPAQRLAGEVRAALASRLAAALPLQDGPPRG